HLPSFSRRLRVSAVSIPWPSSASPRLRVKQELRLFQSPLDRLAAAPEIRRQLDRVPRDLPLVTDLHLVVLKLGRDTEADRVAFHLAIGDRRFPGELAVGFTRQLGAVLLEGKRALDRPVRAFRRSLPVARNVSGERGERE